jgi:hypothetical protein
MEIFAASLLATFSHDQLLLVSLPQSRQSPAQVKKECDTIFAMTTMKPSKTSQK